MDEGFGTLDHGYLDSALEELERHAKHGRIVGIISHVRDIAERVPVIINVELKPTGSVYRMIDEADRHAFIETGIERSLLR